MKRKSCILSALTFMAVILSQSFAAADFWEDLAKGVVKGLEESAQQDAKKKKEEEFNKKINGLLKKLPSSARVAVLEVRMKALEFDTIEDEDARKKAIKALEQVGEPLKNILEEGLGESGITVLDRDAFKEIEKEIVYSQTGEVDPNSSAKFGKAFGATHLLIGNLVYDGFKTGHPTGTFSIKITEVESMKIVGRINFTFDIDQPKESTTSTSQTKKSTASEPQNLLNEGFSVSPGSYKTYSWDFPNDGTLNIVVSADFDVYVLVTDETNYRIFNSGGTANVFANKKITSGSFSVSIPRGSQYIIIYNKDSLLTPASVGMAVSFTSRQ